MAAAVRSIATVDGTTLHHVTTLSIPLSADYRVAIDSNAASVHKGAHPGPLLCELKRMPFKVDNVHTRKCVHMATKNIFLPFAGTQSLFRTDKNARCNNKLVEYVAKDKIVGESIFLNNVYPDKCIFLRYSLLHHVSGPPTYSWSSMCTIESRLVCIYIGQRLLFSREKCVSLKSTGSTHENARFRRKHLYVIEPNFASSELICI